MTIAGTLKWAIALGEAPLRRWERDACDKAVADHAGQFIGVVAAASTASATSLSQRSFARSLQADMEGTSLDALQPDECDRWLESLPRTTDGTVPDIVLCLAGAQAPRDLRAGMRVWKFASADGLDPAVLPVGAREAMKRSYSASMVLADTTSRKLIQHGTFAVFPGEAVRTAVTMADLASNWVRHALLLSARNGAGAQALEFDRPIPCPRPWEVLWNRIARWLIKEGTPHSHVNLADWNIGVLHQPIRTLLNEDASKNVRWFPPPSNGKGRLEPFGYRTADGELNVLYTKTDGERDRSAIARLRPKPDNILKRSRTMLDVEPEHGYPYVVVLQGDVHMLRTVRSENTTDLYRVNASNDGTEPVSTLLNEALYSPTLFEHNGRWWLMGTLRPQVDAALYIYHASHPSGPFAPHMLNPVKCDIAGARPAGTPFVDEGQLWRPALDLSDPGSPAVVIHRVDALAPDRFAETPHRTVEAFANSAYGRGVRTVCAMGDVTLVDGLRSPLLAASEANASRSKRKRSRTSNQNDA